MSLFPEGPPEEWSDLEVFKFLAIVIFTIAIISYFLR